MIRKVLVALDGSARAPGVFERAAAIAARFGAALVPFRAIHVPPEFPAAAAGSESDGLPARLARLALEEIGHVTAQASLEGLSLAAPIVRSGDPSRLILEVSEEVDADLIVMGSHGYSGIDRILGTTAAHVANQARRDVLVVHQRNGVTPGGGGRSGE